MSEHATAQPNLNEPRERVSFAALLIISVLIWASLVACGFLFWLILLAVFLLLANGLLAARARNEGIEATKEQYPDLHKALLEVCSTLGIANPPRLYLLPAGKALNRFTVRYVCRSFAVLAMDPKDLPKASGTEIRFKLGRELGRMRTHLPTKRLLIFPGLLFPLIGNAYSRASILMADRWGAAAAKDAEASAKALLSPSSADPRVMAHQYSESPGFFASWNELTSAQPTLAHRVSAILAEESKAISPTKIHPMAYPAALFVLSGFRSGFANLLFTAVTTLILFGLVLPAHRAARERADAKEAHIEHQERLLSAKEILLTDGTIDPRLAGIWAGGSPADSATSDYLRWTTARKADGNLQTSFEQRANGVEKKWGKHGQWRIYKEKYEEIYDSEKPREYFVLRVEQDSVTLTENPHNANVNITEVRQPGAP